jgi:hypothetical protein
VRVIIAREMTVISGNIVKLFFIFFHISANKDIKGDIMRKGIKEEQVLHGEEAKQRRINWPNEQRK